MKLFEKSVSSDKENLSYRFNDLMTLVNAADKQLAKFMTAYTSDLNNYIKTLTTAEETAAENVRKKIDQFRENHKKVWANKTLYQKQEMVKKVKQTKLERYGDSNYNNIEKNKQTCLEKYGVQNVYQSDDIKEKIKNKLLEKYGVEHPAQSPEILSKMKKTCNEKYGADFFTLTQVFKQDVKNKIMSRMINNNENIIDSFVKDDEIFYLFKCPHLECNKCLNKFYISKAGLNSVRINQGTEVCTNLLPIDYDNGKGTSIELFIQTF